MKDKIKEQYSMETEQAVLACMFMSKYALDKAIDELNSDYFYVDNHKKIFKAITDLKEKGSPIDLTTITAELDKRKELKTIGGYEYLSEIINSTPTAANIDQYIRIINEKAILRRLYETANQIAGNCYSKDESLNEILEDAEMSILNVVKTRKGTEFRTIQEVLYKTQADLEKLSKNKGEITGVATGFYELDHMTTGLHPNELMILAARPGVGKTALALNIATNVVIDLDKTVAIFNMEMAAEQLVGRMISSIGQIDNYKIRTGHLENNDWKRVNEAISRLADTKLYLDDTAGMTIGEIRAKCRRLASSENGLSLIVIDYLTLIQGTSKYAGNRQQEVAEISRSLKTMAMELNVPVIALAQLSRNVEGRENKRPILSDLRESGSIEQDADIVAFLHRDDYYNSENNDKDKDLSETELIIAKHRNGPTGTINLVFQKKTMTFVSVSK